MRRTSGGPNDDRRVVLFRGGRRIATVGDLREPIALARSVRTPDNKDAFIQTLNPYYRTFAAVDFGERRLLDGDNSDKRFSHVFVIRTNEKISVEARDYVVWKNQVFSIQTTKRMDTNGVFTALRCIDWNRLTTQSEAAGLVGGKVTTPPPETHEDNNVFWNKLETGER